MNAQEYFLVSKMVEHLNVIHQYARILHDRTYSEIFEKGNHNLEADLEDVRENMLQALQKSQGLLMLPFDPMISVEQLGHGVVLASTLNSNDAARQD